MSNIISRALASVFGTKADRDLKELRPYVGLILEQAARLAAVSDEELRGRSYALRAAIADRLAPGDAEIDALKTKATTDASITLQQKDEIFARIDTLEAARNKNLEVVLLEVLPEAFAVVKETARRLSERKQLVVPVTDWDIEYAATHPHVRLEGGQAIWPNEWLAAGQEIIWEMVHYDVQLIGGVVLHQGKISEMATGEGKTLVATLPAFLNALAGRGVHIVTVNDYLAKRDSEWMGPLMGFHGLRVDCIDKHEPNSPERRRAYEADITYGTNNEFGFDYLRDNMSREVDELVQRKLHFAMVDEVDSVLIDDARTPLIISGPMVGGDIQEYAQLQPRIARLVDQQKALANRFLNEARRGLAENNDKDGGLALFRAHRALPKSTPLIKLLSEPGKRAILQKTENFYMQDNSKQMPEADEPLLFTIDEKGNQVDLTEGGLRAMTAANEDPDFFILPNLTAIFSQIEGDKALSVQDRVERKDAVLTEYAAKSQRIHTIQQLLKAYCLFDREVEYIVMEGKVKIVDEQTGRIMDGRRYSDGLHQAIEAKEGVRIEDATQTYATVTLQNYFRMYHKLCGMTGTAETEAGEFWQIYKLDVVTIPTNRSVTRRDEQDKIYKTEREKYNAVVDEVVALVEKGRPVLVGTTSVENSEILSRLLKVRKVPHQVLNAKYHQREAEIVAEAGKSGQVTIATNMAGRGTDIKLAPGSKTAGGLAIIGTERHESRRVDRQLRGRSGRQGDPGTSQFFVSLQDPLMRLFGSDRIAKLMDRMGMEEGEVIQHSMITNSIERAQKKVEENNFGIRKRLLEYDDVMNSQREVIYKRRRNALYGERLPLDVQNMIYAGVEDAAMANPGQAGLQAFKERIYHLFAFEPEIAGEDYAKAKPIDVARTIYRLVEKRYAQHMTDLAESAMPVYESIAAQQNGQVQTVVTPFSAPKYGMQIGIPLQEALEQRGANMRFLLERSATLSMIDQEWKEHLREMDDLRQSVQNAALEQKDPLLVYKFEALKMFRNFITEVNDHITTFLFQVEIPVQEEEPGHLAATAQEQMRLQDQMERQAQQRHRQDNALQTNQSRPELDNILDALRHQTMLEEDMVPGQQGIPVAPLRQAPVRAERQVGRNDKVTVRYFANGSLKQGKFKSLEEDLRKGLCEVVDVA